MKVYNRFYLVMIILLMIVTISGCIGNIGQLSGLLSGKSGSTYYVSQREITTIRETEKIPGKPQVCLKTTSTR